MALHASEQSDGPPETGKNNPRSPRFYLIFFFALLVIWFGLCSLLVPAATEKDIDSFVLRRRDSTDQIATSLARNLQDEVRRLGNLPDLLSDDQVLVNFLVQPEGGRPVAGNQLDQVNEHLRQLAELLELDNVYLVSARGIVVATSNYQMPNSLMGASSAARPYFTAIENGGRGRQFGFGTTSGVPGLYFSAAIRKDGLFHGGVVVKRSMRSLFRLTARNPVLLVDEYGVVVASTLVSAMWHFLPESAASGLGSDFLVDRYHHEALSLLDLRPDRGPSPASLVTLPPDPAPSLMTSRPIGDSGLRLVYLSPLPELVDMRAHARLVFWLSFLSGCLLLALLAAALFYGFNNRRRVVALNQRLIDLQRSNAGLVRENDAVQASDQAKSRFLASLSHELRTGFFGILGMVDMLRSADLSPLVLEQVRLLERSARALLGVLDDILDFSDMAAGRLAVDIQACDLQPVFHGLCETHRAAARSKGINFFVEGVDQTLIGMGDRHRLRQITDIFLSNAVRITALGMVKMTVEIKGQGAERALTLRVTDSGPAVAPEAQELLFQPFFQSASIAARNSRGTSLGLAIARRLAEAMGGAVGVESETGQGACFWLSVPFVSADSVPSTPRDHRDLRPTIEDAGPTRRILLAEDDEVNRLVIGGILRRVGHRVVFAVDGRQAVREISRQNFDLVIMDMHMPEMDGMAATRAVRGLTGEKARLPIIGLTADATAAHREEYLDAGLNDLMIKPIGSGELIEMVKRQSLPN